MSEIDCVVFDIGNVLIRWDPCNLYRQMGYTDAMTASILQETGLLRVNHRVLDAGGDFRATLEPLAEEFPHHAEFIRAFDHRWTDMLGGVITTSVTILQTLKRNGVPVYAISNFNREKFDLTRSLLPVLDEIDELVLSGDVGLVKPDAAIFDLLVRRRRLSVERTVFIDDVAQNIETARELGFATIHFDDASTDLAAELLHRGLPAAFLVNACDP